MHPDEPINFGSIAANRGRIDGLVHVADDHHIHIHLRQLVNGEIRLDQNIAIATKWCGGSGDNYYIKQLLAGILEGHLRMKHANRAENVVQAVEHSW